MVASELPRPLPWQVYKRLYSLDVHNTGLLGTEETVQALLELVSSLSELPPPPPQLRRFMLIGRTDE